MKTKSILAMGVFLLAASTLSFGYYFVGKYRIGKNVDNWSWYRCPVSPEGNNMNWVNENCTKLTVTQGGDNMNTPFNNRTPTTTFSQASGQAANQKPIKPNQAQANKVKPENPVIFVVGKNGVIREKKTKPPVTLPALNSELN